MTVAVSSLLGGLGSFRGKLLVTRQFQLQRSRRRERKDQIQLTKRCPKTKIMFLCHDFMTGLMI